jgi:iron complex outermembrane receptor protein
MKLQYHALIGVSLLALSGVAMAQTSPAEAPGAENPAVSSDIIVTARRRDEALQDVPQTVNVVTSDKMQKLNVRTFTDLQGLVPGLTLSGGGSFSTTATVRGVAFNVEASGNNPTIEFYLNDAPISSNFLFQSLFDIGQFELLRGPQGTLRGRASPSGSITVTTRRPVLGEFGGVVNGTATNTDAYKLDAAVNVPIIKDILAVRIAGVLDDNKGQRIRTIRAEDDPTHNPESFAKTQAIRGSVRFEPTDWVALNFMAQVLHQRNGGYTRVQSESLVDGAPQSGRLIRPYDRLAYGDLPSGARQHQETYIWNADFRFSGQKLSYVGTHNFQDLGNLSTSDAADYFAPPGFPVQERTFMDPAGAQAVCAEQGGKAKLTPTNGNYFQCVHSVGKRDSHELRLASETPIAGIFDYVVGALYDRNNTPTYLTQETPLLAAPTVLAAINLTPIVTSGKSTEKSFFGNVTAHFGGLELSGGLRHINYKTTSSVVVGTNTVADSRDNFNTTIYSGSVKYRFNPDLMIYATIGTSWRPGVRVIGDFSAARTARENSFINLPPEKSTSYEAGLRASFLGGRGRFNLSVYQQDFNNYVYRGPGVYYVNQRAVTPTFTIPEVSNFNFVAAVPVRVRGFEAEGSFRITPRWSVDANVSYADGKITNGTIACTDLNGDGIPDINPTQPTLAQLQAAVGPGQSVSQCSGFSSRANFTPNWNANLQSEAGFALTRSFDGFVRGLLTYTGSNKGDPNSSFDDVGAYTLVNLYAGVRDPDGAWEVSLFAKNAFNNHVILGSSSNFGSGTSTLTTGLTTLTFGPGGTPTGSVSSSFSAPYFPVRVVVPRELGISLRVAFGSR